GPGLARVGIEGLEALARDRIGPFAVDVGLILLELDRDILHCASPGVVGSGGPKRPPSRAWLCANNGREPGRMQSPVRGTALFYKALRRAGRRTAPGGGCCTLRADVPGSAGASHGRSPRMLPQTLSSHRWMPPVIPMSLETMRTSPGNLTVRWRELPPPI